MVVVLEVLDSKQAWCSKAVRQKASLSLPCRCRTLFTLWKYWLYFYGLCSFLLLLFFLWETAPSMYECALLLNTFPWESELAAPCVYPHASMSVKTWCYPLLPFPSPFFSFLTVVLWICTVWLWVFSSNRADVNLCTENTSNDVINSPRTPCSAASYWKEKCHQEWCLIALMSLVMSWAALVWFTNQISTLPVLTVKPLNSLNCVNLLWERGGEKEVTGIPISPDSRTPQMWRQEARLETLVFSAWHLCGVESDTIWCLFYACSLHSFQILVSWVELKTKTPDKTTI